jgi:unsaturated rhamnogalacturonyl hydrolase
MRWSPLLLLLAACGPDLNPIEGRLDSLPLAEALGEQGVQSYSCGSLMFDWTQAVWAFGIHRLYATTGDSRWQDCYRAWMDDALPDFGGESPESFHSSDSMSPATLAATLMIESGGDSYTPITDAADRYLASAPRLSNGAIAHWGYDNPYDFQTDQVWIDSMFMFGAYLVRMYALTGDEAYLDSYLEQYEAFSDLCRDPTAQLYRHAWDDSDGVNIPADPVYWARGNAWVLVSAAELLNVVDPGSPAWQRVQPAYQRQAEAFLATQEEEDGLWHTVVNEPEGDDPDNYTETSGSALIGYGLSRGIEAGALEGEPWQLAVSRAAVGIMGRIDERSDGKLVIEGTSFGTNPMEGYEQYVGIAQVDDMMLGYGPAIMLLAHAHGLPLDD